MLNSHNSKLTIIIPTFNRQAYLQRTINFLEKYNFKIVVLDGGDCNSVLNFNPLKTKIIISKTSLFNRLKLSTNYIDTPYVKLLSDDEFLFNNTIENFIDFLETNSDYSSISGKALRFLVNESKIKYFTVYDNFLSHNLSSNKEIERLSLHFENYTPTIFFSIIRTEIWKKIFENFDSSPANIYGIEEILIETVTCLLGKCKVLDELFLLRSDENTSIDINLETLKFFEWIPSSHLINQKYLSFLEKISNLKVFYSQVSPNSIHHIYSKYAEVSKKQIHAKNKFRFIHPRIKNFFPFKIKALIGMIDRIYENYKANLICLHQSKLTELLKNQKIRLDFIQIEQSIITFYKKNYQTVLPPSIDIIEPLMYEEEFDNK